jgi:hypothetical protein
MVNETELFLSGDAYSPHVDHPARSNDDGTAARRKSASLGPFSKERTRIWGQNPIGIDSEQQVGKLYLSQ